MQTKDREDNEMRWENLAVHRVDIQILPSHSRGSLAAFAGEATNAAADRNDKALILTISIRMKAERMKRNCGTKLGFWTGQRKVRVCWKYEE